MDPNVGDGGTIDPDEFDRGSGDPEVGRELTDFFLYLLSDGKALRDYYDRGTRDSLIDQRGFTTRAADLVREGSLKEIEEHILAVRGSYAKPLVIVWPAM
ncbi:MAG: hypothetical protein H0V68_01650 [Actinobacteria bacterium]|nr:hypothetical protein [Actinomycetota bacterium]